MKKFSLFTIFLITFSGCTTIQYYKCDYEIPRRPIKAEYENYPSFLRDGIIPYVYELEALAEYCTKE